MLAAANLSFPVQVLIQWQMRTAYQPLEIITCHVKQKRYVIIFLGRRTYIIYVDNIESLP